jgi:NAD dependent epimerase/dehydratase family enzyme
MSELAATLHRPLWPLRIPAPLLRTGLGELAELFVDGQRVMPERAIALGYHFNYGDIGSALRNLLGTAP